MFNVIPVPSGCSIGIIPITDDFIQVRGAVQRIKPVINTVSIKNCDKRYPCG